MGFPQEKRVRNSSEFAPTPTHKDVTFEYDVFKMLKQYSDYRAMTYSEIVRWLIDIEQGRKRRHSLAKKLTV